jgi:hypothetical protein
MGGNAASTSRGLLRRTISDVGRRTTSAPSVQVSVIFEATAEHRSPGPRISIRQQFRLFALARAIFDILVDDKVNITMTICKLGD